MKPNLYVNVLLTLIALCLMVLTLRAVPLIPPAAASAPLKCTGQLKANAWGGTKPEIGGYTVEIRCSE
jgi:hypothetical protein